MNLKSFSEGACWMIRIIIEIDDQGEEFRVSRKFDQGDEDEGEEDELGMIEMVCTHKEAISAALFEDAIKLTRRLLLEQFQELRNKRN